MRVRRRALVAAPALVCGAVVAWGGPAGADDTYSRTDTFRDCEVVSRLTVRDSGVVEASTELEGEEIPCDVESVSVRLTWVDEDGDQRSVVASASESVRHAVSAPEATEVRSFHSTHFGQSCFPDPDTSVCRSPEYQLRAK